MYSVLSSIGYSCCVSSNSSATHGSTDFPPTSPEFHWLLGTVEHILETLQDLPRTQFPWSFMVFEGHVVGWLFSEISQADKISDDSQLGVKTPEKAVEWT